MKATTMRPAKRRPGALQDERNEIARREAVRQSGLLAPERSPRINRFVADLAASIGKPLSCLTVLDSTTQHAQFGSRELLGAAPLDQSICRHLVFSTDETLLVPDLRHDPRFSHLASVTRPDGVRFYAGSVVRSLDGHRLGSLCVMDHEPGNLAPAQLRALLDATAALERLVEEHRHEQADLREILADIGGRGPSAPLPLALQPIVATRTFARSAPRRCSGGVVRTEPWSVPTCSSPDWKPPASSSPSTAPSCAPPAARRQASRPSSAYRSTSRAHGSSRAWTRCRTPSRWR